MLILDNIFNLKIIGQRIKTERSNLHISQQSLADALNISARQTIAKWEKGIILPQLEDLLNMCNIFHCEIGYLLGEYNCRTRVATDISKETGLTEKSILSLQNIYSKRNQLPTDSFDTDIALADIILRSVNNLLESASNSSIEYSLLGMISQYLYADFTHFYTDDVSDDENLFYPIEELGLWDALHGIDGAFNVYDLADILLLKVQSALQEEREHIRFDVPQTERLTPCPPPTEISIDEEISALEEELNYLREVKMTSPEK